MRRHLVCLAVLAIVTACEPIDDPVVIKADASLIGTWTGTAEITTGNDIGSGRTGQSGTVFPVLLELRRSGRFELIASSYPTSFSDFEERTCSGLWERSGHTIEFFPVEACRALPFSKYTIGRTLPDGITLNATTATSPVHTPGNIRSRLVLDRG